MLMYLELYNKKSIDIDIDIHDIDIDRYIHDIDIIKKYIIDYLAISKEFPTCMVCLEYGFTKELPPLFNDKITILLNPLREWQNKYLINNSDIGLTNFYKNDNPLRIGDKKAKEIYNSHKYSDIFKQMLNNFKWMK